MRIKIKNINFFVIVFFSHTIMVELRFVPLAMENANFQCDNINGTVAEFGCSINENKWSETTLDLILHHFYSSRFNQALNRYLYGVSSSGNDIKKFSRSVDEDDDVVNHMPRMFKRDLSGELDFKEMSKNILDMNKELTIMTRNLSVMTDELALINVN